MILDFGDGYVLRQANAADHECLAKVCLQTGAAGADATAIEDDPDLLGLLYAIPYQLFEPDLAFAIEGPNGVCGYLFGVLDTRAFNVQLAEEWYPVLNQRVNDPGPDPSTWLGSDWARRLIHHPQLDVPTALDAYPSHGHIDLLPKARGRGIGGAAMRYLERRLVEAGAPGMHLQVNPANANALGFYQHLGFEILQDNKLQDGVMFVAKRFPRQS